MGAIARGASASRLTVTAVGRRLQQASPDLALDFGMERMIGIDVDEIINQVYEDLISLGDLAVVELEKLRAWYHETSG